MARGHLFQERFEKIADEEDLLDRAIARIYLGTASWIDRIQELLDETERSEGPRALRFIPAGLSSRT